MERNWLEGSWSGLNPQSPSSVRIAGDRDDLSERVHSVLKIPPASIWAMGR